MSSRRILVRIASDWDSSGLLHRTSGGAGIWDNVEFTTKNAPACDLLVVLNNRKLDDIRVLCPPNNVWAIMQEPYVPGRWTEKVADCFLSWTVPLYMGCTNLEDYFPSGSFIRIDADDPPAVCARIRQLIAGGEWERRLPALDLARRRVLSEYQIFPYLVQLMRKYPLNSGSKREVVIPGYRHRRSHHRLRYLGQKTRHGEAADLWNAFVSKCKYSWWFRGVIQ